MRYGIGIGVILAASFLFTLKLSTNVQVSKMKEYMGELCGISGPLAGDDPQVVEVLRQRYLDPPSSLPYNLSKVNESLGTHTLTWPWIRSHLDIMFAGEREGFFIEAGALDGQYLSNTLWLERTMGWTGLLIEPDTLSYKSLLEKRRKSWSSNTCISTEVYPKKVTFISNFLKWKANISPWAFRGHSHVLRDDLSQDSYINFQYEDMRNSTIQCFPLTTYLEAINVSKVDLLSLDVQGSEVEIVRSVLNQSKFKVRVIVAEDEYDKFDEQIFDLLYKNGYVIYAANVDIIFAKEDDPLFQKAEVKNFLKNKIRNENKYVNKED